ncbi:hypothetical protein DFH09DRAFT_1079622 [Mycena vulgaris]|nr:hypothetical protein DFH09DRAFT_1079622 [Mycena vulgaris]
MSLSPNPAQTRLNIIISCLTATVSTLEAVSASLKTPFLEAISHTVRSLLTAVQMLEQINDLLQAIIGLHINSGAGGELSLNMLQNLGKFTETLHKIHTFAEAKQEQSRIKQFFRQGEMTTLLESCRLGLEQALEMFKQCHRHAGIYSEETPGGPGTAFIPVR